MNGKMIVTLLQTDIKWGASAENIRSAERLINSSQPSDLYVLPEMWSTGFATNPEGIAHEEDTNEALIWMRTIAKERHCAICGSLAIHLSDNSYRNRHYFIDGRNHRRRCFMTSIISLLMVGKINIILPVSHMSLWNMKGSVSYCLPAMTSVFPVGADMLMTENTISLLW